MKASSCFSLLSSLLASSASRAAVAATGPENNRHLDLSSSSTLDPIDEQETLSIYSKLAQQQCNFSQPLSTLITAKPGDACSFRVRVGIARLGVDIVEDVTSENNIDNSGGNSTTVFLEGTRDLIVWNMDNQNNAFRCFFHQTMNTTTTTTTTTFTNNNKYENVVERGDDIMFFYPTDVLSNGVENVVSAPGLYHMVDGMVGWRTDTASGSSNVTEIDGEFVNLCEELGGGGEGGSSSLLYPTTLEESSSKQQVDDYPPSSTDGGDPSVSIFNAESTSSAYYNLAQVSWQVVMVVMIFGRCVCDF
ncbi:hypothetical protein ACHAWT_002101 [Skeletonema menzelii]